MGKFGKIDVWWSIRKVEKVFNVGLYMVIRQVNEIFSPNLFVHRNGHKLKF